MTTQDMTAKPIPEPPRATVGVMGWLHQNLFKSWVDGTVTVIVAAVVLWAAYTLIVWIFGAADFTAVYSRFKLYFVGQYPVDELWRPQLSLLGISALAGMAWRRWRDSNMVGVTFAAGLVLITVVIALLPLQMGLVNRVMLLLTPVAIAGGYFAMVIPRVGGDRLFAYSMIGVVVVSLFIIPGATWIPGLEAIDAQAIGGLMLNLWLAVIGIAGALPFGILLALGRRSRLPFVKMLCVAYIELIRGVPLITLLFMSRHILPLAFPGQFSINELYLGAITITLFSSAYVAEIVRGGMAAVPNGQTEAARALGLSTWQTTLTITLPQALRNIIPPMVSQFISLFKDTSLVFIIGMLDIIEMGKVTIQGNLEFTEHGREVYLFIGLVFWVLTYGMSWVSRIIERALGVGQR